MDAYMQSVHHLKMQPVNLDSLMPLITDLCQTSSDVRLLRRDDGGNLRRNDGLRRDDSEKCLHHPVVATAATNGKEVVYNCPLENDCPHWKMYNLGYRSMLCMNHCENTATRHPEYLQPNPYDYEYDTDEESIMNAVEPLPIEELKMWLDNDDDDEDFFDGGECVDGGGCGELLQQEDFDCDDNNLNDEFEEDE